MKTDIVFEMRKFEPMSRRLRIGFCAILTVLLPSFPARVQDMNQTPTSQNHMDEECKGNLQRIYKLLKFHLHHSAGAMGFPSDLDLLYGMSKEQKVFICPGDKELSNSKGGDTFRTSYEVLSDPLDPRLSTTSASRIAIISDKRPNHKGQRFVLFYDGSVRAFGKAQFEKLRNDKFIDLRPTDTRD